MSESIEEIIWRSIHDGIDINDSYALDKAIDHDNDSMNLLKSIKTHLEGQGILPILFQIQKEIYAQTWEKQIQEYMSVQFANKIITIQDLKSGLESFIHSYFLAYQKLNNAIVSIIGKKYKKEFFNNSDFKNQTKESSPVKHMEDILDNNDSLNKTNSFYSEIVDDIVKVKNESTIMKIMPISDKESSEVQLDYVNASSSKMSESESESQHLGWLWGNRKMFTSTHPKPEHVVGDNSTKITSSLNSQICDKVPNVKVMNNAFKTTIDLRPKCNDKLGKILQDQSAHIEILKNSTQALSKFDAKINNADENRRLSAFSEDVQNKENANIFKVI